MGTSRREKERKREREKIFYTGRMIDISQVGRESMDNDLSQWTDNSNDEKRKQGE